MHARCLASLACLVLLVAPGSARAGNDDELLVGNQAAMLGGAVSATVSDSSATWYNPAGLGATDRDQVDVSATVYNLRLYHAPTFIASTDGARTSASVAEVVVAPAQVAFVRRLRPGLALGLGYFVPRSTDYALRESLRAGTAQASDWQVAEAIAETQHHLAAGLGHALGSRARAGVSVIGGYSASRTMFMLYGSRGEAGATREAWSASFLGTQTRLSAELGLGLQAEPIPGLIVALSLRSPQLLLRASSDALRNQLAGSQDDDRLESQARQPRTHSGLGLWRSGRAGLGLAYRYARGHVSAELDVQPPLHRPSLGLARETLVNARLGLYHTLSPAFALGFGVFTDRASQAVSWQVVSVRGDYYGVTAGLEYTNPHLLAASERASSIEFTSVVALRYAYSAGDFGTLLVDAAKLPDQAFESRRGRLTVHELGLYVGSGLRF
jgi:hypothetical protein